MEFPVDILATLSHEDLEQSAEDYMSDLLYSNPDKAEHFTLPSSRRIPLSISNIGFVPLYGGDLKHKVLALFAPEDQFTAVALYLADQWWAVDDILKTADPSRKGLLKVRSLGERIALYILNRIVYRAKEMSKNEVPFLCHSESDYAKVLWKNGEAVGFYSVKPTGSLCNSFLTQRYLLPVMDSIFVRKIHRGNGYGLQILEDFVDCFKEDSLGLKYPLSQAMLKVCGQYLNTYPADGDLLWEVESVGGPFQRTRIANKLQTLAVRVNHHSGGDALLHQNSAENDVAMEEVSNSVEVTEVMMVNKHLRGGKDTPVSTRTRSSDYKRKRIREDSEEVTEESLPDKITRVEDSAAANVEGAAGEAMEGEGQPAPADEEGEGEEQPAPINEEVAGEEQLEPADEEVEGKDEEEPVPSSEEVEEHVAPEMAAQEEENNTLEVELLAKVEAERINGEVTDDFGEEEGEAVMEHAAVKENRSQEEEEEEEEEEGQKDVDMVEEAAEDTVQEKDTVGTTPEEEEQSSPAEEESSPVEEQTSPEEEASPAKEEEQTSPAEEASPAEEEEQTSPAEEVSPAEEEEQTSPAEEVSPAEEASPAKELTSPEKEEAPLVEEAQPPKEDAPPMEEEAMALEVVSPKEEEAPPKEDGVLPAEQVSPVNGDSPVDQVEDSVDHQKDPEVEEPVPEVVNEAAVVPDKVMPQDKEEEEGMEEEPSPDAAPLEEVDSPSDPSPLLDKDSMDLSEATVLLVDLKEISYQQPGDNETDQTAEEVEKMEEVEGVQTEDDVEQGKETEDEKTEEDREATTTEEEGETVEKNLDDPNGPLSMDMRVLRGKTKVIQATPKRKSTRLSKRPLEDDQTEPSEAEDEPAEKEEEKATTTEEEAEVEKSSDDTDEPPVVDRRVLRQKSKLVQSASKPKPKRRSKT
ncbi:hypothetical protein AAFF_G00016020 [Aldrovandia affinis]|uniref:Soluble lamin-associated protein of 75 kDa-like n=1 Tax=Aldrovandia affinis TaxID=143900 RepID=A0AAD7WGS2_9TELE|nr:hypothetical protein AAFF_G00016020 [Aldrovandia affinis]